MSAAIDFLGAPLTPLTCAEAATAIVERPADAPFSYVVALEVDDVVGLAHDPGRAPLYDGAWRILNASPLLRRLARCSGVAAPVCGAVDLTAAMFDGHIDPREAVTIVGASESVVAGLQTRYGLRDVRWHAPPMRIDAAAMARAAAFIAAQRARFVFIALPSPQQEMMAKAAVERGDATGLGLCVGESLAVLAGAQRRSPDWMRRFGERLFVDGPALAWAWLRWSQRRAAISSRSAR